MASLPHICFFDGTLVHSCFVCVISFPCTSVCCQFIVRQLQEARVQKTVSDQRAGKKQGNKLLLQLKNHVLFVLAPDPITILCPLWFCFPPPPPPPPTMIQIYWKMK